MGKKDRAVKNKKAVGCTKRSKRNLIVAVIAILAMGVGIWVYVTAASSSNDAIGTNQENGNPTVTGKWMDVHGVGVFTTGNDSSLYLATHNGLFKKENGNSSSGWVEVGNDKSDLMGFTINPSKEGVMYSSGHPQTGGNLGFRVSTDYGITWQKVSDVTNPPIDFHAMTVGNNPETIYGSSGMGNIIYATHNEGKTWTGVSPPNRERAIMLEANQTDSKILYTSTASGLYSSMGQGNNWQKIDTVLVGEGAVVTGLGIPSNNGKIAYAFVIPNQGEDGYIIKSTDGAKTWAKTDGQIKGAKYLGKFAFGKDGEVYATVNQDTPNGAASSVYSSNDEGKTWMLEGTNSKSA
ncbi:MAG TPA: hypothetical protein VER14_04320 [Phototrophicaceae bacterium]|nr:hypothetical protein [Phototrophicaceae bacterium]